MGGPVELIVILFAALMVLPLAVYYPLFVARFVAVRWKAKRKGLAARPSWGVLAVYSWCLVTLASAAVGIPEFMKFAGRSKVSEATVNLGVIFTSETAYFGEHNTYAGRPGVNGSGAFKDVQWVPEGNTNYGYFLGGDYIPPSREGVEIKFTSESGWPFRVRPAVNATEFTALAVGNIDRDEVLDVWMINDARELRQLVDDVRDVDLADVCEGCPGLARRSEAGKMWETMIAPAVRAVLGLFFLTSPLLLLAVPALYFLLMRERRKWKEISSP